MDLGPLPVLVQEEIQEDLLIEFEFGVVFDEFHILVVVGDPVQLEHQDVWWSADPCFENLALARLVSFEALDLGLAECFPSLVKLPFVNSELNRAHFVNVLILNGGSAIGINN